MNDSCYHLIEPLFSSLKSLYKLRLGLQESSRKILSREGNPQSCTVFSVGQADPFYDAKTAGESPLLDEAPVQIAKLKQTPRLQQVDGLQQPTGRHEPLSPDNLPPVQAIAPGVVQYDFEIEGKHSTPVKRATQPLF